MNNLKTLSLSIAIAMFLITATDAQQITLDQVQVTNSTGTQIYTTNNDKDVQGTPFYSEDWQMGKVIFNNSKFSKEVPLSYNSYTQELFFKQQEIIKVLDPKQIKGFVFTKTGETFKYGNSSEEFEITPSTPLRVIYDGKVELLVLHQTVRTRGNTKDPLTGKVTDRYSKSETFLIKKTDGSFKKTRIRKKNMINDLGTHKKELEKFTKDNRNKVKSEKDAVELLEFYDSLLDK